MSVSTGYVRTHIYTEAMRTKKTLSAWIPLVSIFCSSGAVSGIRGKQMMPAIASERSIFSKNNDYNTYIKSFPCRGEHVRTYISGYRCTRWQKTKNRQDTHTHTHTRDSHSDDNNKDYSKRWSSIGIIQRIRMQNHSTWSTCANLK